MKAVGVWFRSSATGRYLYLLRNDTRHPGSWGLPGGKVETGETLLGAMERECIEELGCSHNGPPCFGTRIHDGRPYFRTRIVFRTDEPRSASARVQDSEAWRVH